MCLGFDSNIESEGFDRPFALPYGQEFLIDEVTKVHNNVITVINSGGGIDFRNWRNKVKAILMAWYPGQEGGKAIAEILTGKISPSGKLPISIEENGKTILHSTTTMTSVMFRTREFNTLKAYL